MLARRPWCVIALSTLVLAVAGAGCGGSGGGAPVVLTPESLTREATLDGMNVTLAIKNEKAPELTWAKTDQVIAAFSGHQINVSKKQVTLDNKTKKLPEGVKTVAIVYENDTITIQADGKELFGPSVK